MQAGCYNPQYDPQLREDHLSARRLTRKLNGLSEEELDTAHPIDAGVRNAGLEYGAPITIGSNVWIGGGTTVNPGVTIGSNTVIGSGSVVVKDIPSNVIAEGNPCKVLREITKEDKRYWEEKRKQYEASRSTDAG